MDELDSRSFLRERILTDLRNTVKQVYHESVRNELSPHNRTYVCLTLIKNLDEVLRHGLKQLHLGYWKAVCQILHPQMLEAVEKLPTQNNAESNGLMKGKTWIALSLKDDSFCNYIQCLVSEGCLEKFYDDWSILRTNDNCHHFLSILSGLENIRFTFEVEFVNKPPSFCNFGTKVVSNIDILNLSRSKSSINFATSTSSLTSPVDSGVHLQDFSYDLEQMSDDNHKDFDIDYFNGNVPEPVLLRKKKKDSKRHVSFHEDIIYKSPEKCRKLKWDSENLRYSWSGEQIDSSILKNSNFTEIKLSECRVDSTPLKSYDIKEREAPEGEETPTSEREEPLNKKVQNSVLVKRFLQGVRNRTRTLGRHNQCESQNFSTCNFKKCKIDYTLFEKFDMEIRNEMDRYPKVTSTRHEVTLHSELIRDMIRNQTLYKCYKLRDFLLVITNANLHIINKNLEMKRIHFRDLKNIAVYPDFQAFNIFNTDEEFNDVSNVFVTGDSELTNEVLGRLEFSMRRHRFDPPMFYFLSHGYFSSIRRNLIENMAIGKKEEFIFMGTVHLSKENDLLSTVLPTSKRGFLMYRQMESGGSWMPGDFYLKNGTLYMFGDDTSLPKLAINIATGCRSCNRTKNSDRPHTFQMTLVENELKWSNDQRNPRPKSAYYPDHNFVKAENGKFFTRIRQKMGRILTFGEAKESCSALEFAAASEYELAEWFEMIIQASCGDFCEEAHKDDLVGGMLWVTENCLVITNELWSIRDVAVDIKSCAQLRDVAALRIGEYEKDFFVVIEFICMEANSTSGDWILYLNSREELRRLIRKLQTHWKFNEKFPCEEMREGRLLSKCRKSQGGLTNNCWNPLIQ